MPQEINTCSKPTIETLEQDVKYDPSQWRCTGVFVFNFEHISHLFLVFLLIVSDVYFESSKTPIIEIFAKIVKLIVSLS